MVWIAHFPEILPAAAGRVVAIGNFDGVHAGHRSLLALAKAEAVQRGVELVVLTFEPHPRSVLRPEIPLKRLTTLEEKSYLLETVGVDGVAVLDFTKDVAAWAPEAFVEDVLVNWLGAAAVCVGENFRFGRKAAGTVETLRAETRLTTLTAPLFTDEIGVVSSSRLRGG